MSGGRPRGPAATAPPRKEHAIKILWHSNCPWAASGYGQQTALFAPRIRDLGHDVAISSFWGLKGSIQTWDGMNVYPDDGTQGNRTLPSHASHHAGGDPADCLTITLMDVWVLASEKLNELRMASWVPVDHYPVPPKVKWFFDDRPARPIAMSRFGEDALRKVGLDPLYVPHGIDTTVLRPREITPDALSALAIPEGSFVVGMVAANQGNEPSRKNFPAAFEAFACFHDQHPDSVLYVYTDATGECAPGVSTNLVALANLMCIPDHAIRWAPQYERELGLITPDAMSWLYSAFDVLLAPSYGEGFGIPIIEAQACGTPVIVTDWTAMPELCGAGWLVDGQRFFNESHHSYWKNANVDSIIDALEQAYEARGTLGGKAREFALQYDVDTVMRDFWVPVLEQLDRPREVPALVLPNRAMRRAAGKGKAA